MAMSKEPRAIAVAAVFNGVSYAVTRHGSEPQSFEWLPSIKKIGGKNQLARRLASNANELLAVTPAPLGEPG